MTLLKRILLFGMISVAVCLTGCRTSTLTEAHKIYTGAVEPLTVEEQTLYDSIVIPLLQQDLWTSRDMYDAAHDLMIPMYYAFWARNEQAVREFGAFFDRFTQDVTQDDVYEFNQQELLNRTQFLYLATQFMCLSVENGWEILIPAELPEYCQEGAIQVLQYYNPNIGRTLEEHIRFMCEGGNYPYPWYGDISDLMQFAVAILCDLYVVNNSIGGGWKDDVAIQTGIELSYEIFSTPYLNVETENGGWLFQPGIYAGHPNYQYAGNLNITEGMEPNIVEGIAKDTSHFMRVPLMLRSYQAVQPDVQRTALFQLRREQLSNQMMNHVLQQQNGMWVVTNYLDGNNGVYRYREETGLGYEGYQVSGTLVVGWWSLLQDERITEIYKEIRTYFPLSANEQNPYFDPATTRQQNPFFDANTAYELGTFECIVTCASKLLPA